MPDPMLVFASTLATILTYVGWGVLIYAALRFVNWYQFDRHDRKPKETKTYDPKPAEPQPEPRTAPTTRPASARRTTRPSVWLREQRDPGATRPRTPVVPNRFEGDWRG